MLFDVHTSEREGWVVIAVVGDLDLAAAPKVRHAVRQALVPPEGERSLPPRVVLDLRGVDFIDSSGLGVVLGALKRVRLAAGELRLVVEAGSVRSVLELTGLDRILPLVASVDDAVGPAGPAGSEGIAGPAIGTGTAAGGTGARGTGSRG